MNRFAVERTESREMSWPGSPDIGRAPALMHWGDTINRVTTERIERRVGLRLFGRWFGYESSTTQRRIDTLQLMQTDAMASSASPMPRGQFALAGGGVLAIALLGGAIGALLVPQATNSVPLLTTLPESRPIAMPAAQATPRVIVQRVMLAAPAAVPAAAAATVPGTVAIDADPVPDKSPSLSQARATALSSGEPAYWAEGSRSGVVVAGPERANNGQMCRLVAVFTRVEGDRGSTQSTTQCRAATGQPKN